MPYTGIGQDWRAALPRSPLREGSPAAAHRRALLEPPQLFLLIPSHPTTAITTRHPVIGQGPQPAVRPGSPLRNEHPAAIRPRSLLETPHFFRRRYRLVKQQHPRMRPSASGATSKPFSRRTPRTRTAYSTRWSTFCASPSTSGGSCRFSSATRLRQANANTPL